MPNILLEPDGRMLLLMLFMVVSLLVMVIRGKSFMDVPKGKHARRSNWIAVLVFGTLVVLFLTSDWSML